MGGGLGLLLTSAGQAFSLLLMIGAGTGLIYILRWFWWRINAYTEIIATFITPPDDEKTLLNFVKKVNPGGPGWSKYTLNESKEIWQLPRGILLMFLGCSAVYSVLLGVGQLIYGNQLGYFLILLSIISFDLSK